jgi:fibronectin type 3 domain-containing protein
MILIQRIHTIIAVLAIIFILAIVFQAQAATLEWDASVDATHYKVYQSSTSNVYNKAAGQVCDVTGLTCVVNGLPDNSTFYFVATAFDAAGNESAFSNQVTLVTTDTIPPAPPGNFRSILQVVWNWFKGLFGKSLRATA